MSCYYNMLQSCVDCATENFGMCKFPNGQMTDSMREVDELKKRIAQLEHENAVLRHTMKGEQVVLDFWKDGDVCHVVTTDGEEIYDYQKWKDGNTTIYDKREREEIIRCRDCDNLNIIGKCPCGFWALENLNGFCAWAVRRDA